MSDFMRDIIVQLEGIAPKGLELPKNLPNLINTDSRAIGTGDWFLPIVGENFDGHKFISNAMEKAAGFFYQKDRKDLVPKELLDRGVAIGNSVSFFQKLARKWRDSLPCKVIGITGSAGKTTAKEMCAHILSQAGNSHWAKGSFNNEIGVPITLCSLTQDHRFAVIEMGARHAGDIAFLAEIVNPDVAVVLNIGTAHIGEFGGADILRRTKQEMFTHTRKDAIAIFPSDDSVAGEVAKRHHPQSYGFGVSSGDVQVRALGQSQGKMELEVITDLGKITCRSSAFHTVYPINFAAAIAVARSLGVDIQAITAGIESFMGVDGRFRVYEAENYTLIDDSYNANPQSMQAGLESVRQGFSQPDKILVLGDMLELGPDSQREHEEIGRICAQQIKPAYLVTVGPESQYLKKSAVLHGIDPEHTQHYPDVTSAIQDMSDILKHGKLLYAKASNGIKLNLFIESAQKELAYKKADNSSQKGDSIAVPPAH